MSEHRPLQSLNSNIPFLHPSTPPSTSTAKPPTSRAPPRPPLKLAPIFTRSYRSTPPRSHSYPIAAASTSQASSSSPSQPRTPTDDEPLRKRARVASTIHDRYFDLDAGVGVGSLDSLDDADEEAFFGYDHDKRLKMHSIQEYFVTTPLHANTYSLDCKDPHPTNRIRGLHRGVETRKEVYGVWRRKRGRFGVRFSNTGHDLDSLATMSNQHYDGDVPYLSTLVTSLNHHPDKPPSLLLIPSLHPWHQPRDFAPPLAVSFSHCAKTHSAYMAKEHDVRRLIAVAAEEGGVRVVDVDEPLGMHREAKGWFWRAHGNAVLDAKWSGDDTKILTASGDQTARLHALDSPTPSLLATLTGHTASLKACVFFDPTRSSSTDSSSSVIATTGRDGHILVYDIRASGRISPSPSPNPTPDAPGVRRSGRTRYSAGVPGFAAQEGGEIGPVLEIRSAHGDGSKKKSTRSVTSLTSLTSLKTMPGILASGSALDGIVKLWDPRFSTRTNPQAITSLPDPTVGTTSHRSRGIHAMVEQPTTGDLHILTGDSQIHVVRPTAATSCTSSGGLGSLGLLSEAIQPVKYTHPELRSTFWMGLAFSPCGRYLASGSARRGLMTWDVARNDSNVVRLGAGGAREVVATRLGMGDGWRGSQERDREVNAVDWGYDMLAACADDFGTRIWRENKEAAEWLRRDGSGNAQEEWAGVV